MAGSIDALRIAWPAVLEFSVIIPVKDGAGSIPPLLASLDAQTLARERFEVIVVDNASRDGTGAVARELGATVVEEPVANRSRARNRGARAAGSDRFAFIDADCVATTGWLEAMLDCAATAPLLAGAVRVTTNQPPNAIERFEALWRFDQASWVSQGWAATANMCVERTAFEAVGGLDETYRHIGEDVDFCVRAIRAGYALGYCPDAVVTHGAEHRLRPFLRRSWAHGYSGNQAHYRLGLGYRAWRRPRPLLRGRTALGLYEVAPDGFDPDEWRRMSRLAQISYAARITGSVWAEVRRAR
jgi:GT2 family glycosyltransferase